MDANQVAESLGVTPVYMRKESIRWSSAVQLYQEMLSNANSETTSPEGPRTPEGTPERVPPMPPNIPLNANTDLPNAVPVPAIRSNRSLTNLGMLMSPSNASCPSLPVSRSHYGLGCLSPTNWSAAVNRRGSQLGSPGDSSINSLELEAVAAVHELSFAVEAIWVSEMLPRTPELIFVNVTTVEGQPFCLELTGKGWRVTSLRHDCMNGDINHLDLHIRYFENIYSLMDNISEGYRNRFSEALSARLKQLETQESQTSMTSSEGGKGGSGSGISLNLRAQESNTSVASENVISAMLAQQEEQEIDLLKQEASSSSTSSVPVEIPGVTSGPLRPPAGSKERTELVLDPSDTQPGLAVKVRVTVRHPSGDGKRQDFPQGSPSGRPIFDKK